MTVRKLSKQFLSLPVYYILRDLYASAKDVKGFFLVRREYTNFSFVKNLAGVLRMFLSPQKTILCYPGRPSSYHVIYKLCALCGYKISINPHKKCDAVFWSHSSTFPDRSDVQSFLERGEKVINSNCTNLSKELVGSCFEEIFGYSLDVDPTNYRGSIVKKSIYNGTNFATTIEGPISEEDLHEEHVYQKEIKNQSEFDDLTVVYRVPVYAGRIPVVFLKYRPYEFQFTGYYEKVDLKKAGDIFSEDERSKILEMNKKMGIDYGECDVLRDSDGRIYVVDVNSHPGGPPRKMSHNQKVKASKVLIPDFKNLAEKFSNE
jgi:hypothetical protein